MPKPEPPRPGKDRLSVTEINLAVTERPPAMPMRPPKELAAPRPPLPSVRDQTIAELAEQAREAKAEADRAKAEADHWRAAAEAAKRAPPAIIYSLPPPDKKAWQKSLYAFLGALTLFLGGAGTYLGARAATKEQKVDTVIAANSAQQIVVDPLPGQVAELERKLALWKEWARLHTDFDRQVFGKLNVKIHAPPNALPVDPLKTTTRPRRGTSAPILEIDSDPPPLP